MNDRFAAQSAAGFIFERSWRPRTAILTPVLRIDVPTDGAVRPLIQGMPTRLIATLCVLFALPSIAFCDNPLADLPSKPGPHVARICAMGDDAWLELGKPQADPKWGTARGRSWTAKMAYAPDLRAAFLFGEGQHGWWNKENGRYMDDLWAYDVNAHRWVCVYPAPTSQPRPAPEQRRRRGRQPTASRSRSPRWCTATKAPLRQRPPPLPVHALLRRILGGGDGRAPDEVARGRQAQRGRQGLQPLDVRHAKRTSGTARHGGRRRHRSPTGGFGDVLIYIPGAEARLPSHGRARKSGGTTSPPTSGIR